MANEDMTGLVSVMNEILKELRTMNQKLDSVVENGLVSLEDIHSELCSIEEAVSNSAKRTIREIKGPGPYDTITDIGRIVTSSMEGLRGNGRFNSLSELGDRMNRMQDEIMGPGPYNSIAEIYDKMTKQSTPQPTEPQPTEPQQGKDTGAAGKTEAAAKKS